MTRSETIKNQFDLAAESYGVNGPPPVLHIFATRVRRVSELLHDLNGLNILDAGCGPGFMIDKLLEKRGSYFGVDLSQTMLHEAKNRHESGTPVCLAAGDMEVLPFQSTSFDLLLCLGALEYIDDADIVLGEFSRVMKSDSTLIVSMQNRLSLYRFWERYIYRGFLFDVIRKIRRRPIAGKPLENLISVNDLRKVFSRHSLVMKDLLYYNFDLFLKPLDNFFPRLSVMISRMLEFLYRSKAGFLAADFIIVARKE